MLNKVTLIGNLGADPLLKTFDNGSVVAELGLATTENYKDKQGEWQQKTEWHRISIWGNDANRAIAQLKKGHRIYLEGKIETRKWDDKDGKTNYTTGIISRYWRSLEKRETAAATTAAPASAIGTPVVAGNFDDLPF